MNSYTLKPDTVTHTELQCYSFRYSPFVTRATEAEATTTAVREATVAAAVMAAAVMTVKEGWGVRI